MKFFYFSLLFLFSPLLIISQVNFYGNVYDKSSKETLIGANIFVDNKFITSTDFNGEYEFVIEEKEKYKIEVSFVGYENITKEVNGSKKEAKNDFYLSNKKLSEVSVVADIAIDRKTPVAFSTINAEKIESELASQDIPMILNSTPGVYATQQGGGDGDARITIRGFNQRNVAVMIDGIPVNDMENGWVYWSNWFGLDAVTSNIQVQRGLGSSKIAIPSVGGTMNIITKGIKSKNFMKVKQEIGSFGYYRTSLGLNMKNKKGWGFTLASSYKKGIGYVDQAYTEGLFYYAKIQKQLNKHIITFTAMGAPQHHGQRSYKNSIATYSEQAANDLNVDTSYFPEVFDLGYDYNEHVGEIDRYRINEYGDTIHSSYTRLNTKKNYYHKPQFSIRDFWSLDDNLYISNIIYASIGQGGGTSLSNGYNNINDLGLINLQSIYDNNISFIDGLYSNEATKSTSILRSSINNHYWIGGLSTLNYRPNDFVSFSGGLDYRSYKGEHYREVYDLLGGDYYINENNKTQTNIMKYVGDKIDYHNDGIVNWKGGFGQIEIDNNDNLSGFINFSTARSKYKRIDYFKKMDLVLEDTTITQCLGTSKQVVYDPISQTYSVIMVEDSVEYNGVIYTRNSEYARHTETNWEKFNSYTFKSGINYNIDDKHNVFFNTGLISKAPRFNNVFDYSNQLFKNIQNEKVRAFELGHSYRSNTFSSNLNLYYTIWENKPSNGGVIVIIDDVTYRSNINGMDAIHKGVEFDFAYRINKKWTIEGLASIGDWKWNSSDTVRFYDDDNNLVVDEFGNVVEQAFDAENVKVSDAAQTQFGYSIKWSPSRKFWAKIKTTLFRDYYAEFDPLSLEGENSGRQSWQIPNYKIVNFHCGYKFIDFYKNIDCEIKMSVLNATNEIYIADAQNNDSYNNPSFNDFDAKSSSVFFGMPRRVNLSLTLNF